MFLLLIFYLYFGEPAPRIPRGSELLIAVLGEAPGYREIPLFQGMKSFCSNLTAAGILFPLATSMI